MRKSKSANAAPVGPPTPLPAGEAAGVGSGAETLLQGLPWGVVVLDAHGTVRHLNQQAAHWWGLAPDSLQGQQLGPATAGALPPDLQRALRRVPGEPAPLPPAEFFLPLPQQWITMSSARQADDWVVYWQDITAQKQSEQQHQTRQAASDLLRRRTEAVARTGSYEVELATGQFQFSDGLFRLFGEEPGAFTPSSSFIDARSHPDDIGAVQQVIAQAIADRQPYYYQRRIYLPDGQLRTLESHGQVECDAQGRPVKMLGLLQDVTEREQAAQELLRLKDELAQRAADSYTTFYNSMDEGFCIVEVLFDAAQQPTDYRFLDVNPAFEKQTGLYRALGKTIRELVPAIEPLWSDVYGRVSRTGEPMRFEANVESMSRWFDINAFPIGALENRHVGVLFTDSTARKRTEETLRRSETRYRSLFANMEQGFCLLEKVAIAPHEPSDYRYLAVNPAFARHSGLADAAGKTLRELVPGVEARIVAIYDEVVHSGEPRRFEEHVAELNLWIEAEVVPDTHPGHLTVLFSNVSARRRAEETLRQSEEQFRLLVTATADTVYRMSADWTHMEQLIGKNFLADSPCPTHTWVEEYLLVEDLPSVQAAIAEAIRDKSPFELEHRVRRADGTVGWTYSRAIPVLGARGELTGWLGAASDVSARKQAETQLLELTAGLEQQVAERTQELHESRHLLQTVFDTSPTAIVVMRILRDAADQAEDFEILIFNAFNKQVVGRDDLAGQRFTAMFPQTVPAGVLARMLQVATTGEPADFEGWYEGEGMQHWFRHIAVRQDGLLVLTSEVITARKLLEQAQAQSLARLQQSEAVASMGSWDYDLATRELTWSEGLYHLLGRPVGSAVGPQLFLDAVLDDDRPAVARLVRTLTTGAGRFDAPLRLRVGDAVKTVRFKAVPLPPKPGPPVRVLGVCLDVSDVARLEGENLALKLDRHKELLLAILQAQEDERQRLGEVLHNSLGQVLYATKLHLDQLDTPALHALPALAALHQHTGRLLAEAMHQTRTLAHELVPTSLANFGLAVAVRDVCRDLSTPQLRIECQIWGEEHALPQPVQVTLFRLAQELAHNIVRHAGATQALLELETLPNWVSLRAEDNGHGFDPHTVAEGLGLRTLRDAVALLGGTVALDSSPELGTHVRLRIPLPLFS